MNIRDKSVGFMIIRNLLPPDGGWSEAIHRTGSCTFITNFAFRAQHGALFQSNTGCLSQRNIQNIIPTCSTKSINSVENYKNQLRTASARKYLHNYQHPFLKFACREQGGKNNSNLIEIIFSCNSLQILEMKITNQLNQRTSCNITNFFMPICCLQTGCSFYSKI